MSTVATPPVSSPADSGAGYTRRQRLLIWLISNVAALAVRLIGATLRYSVYTEKDGPASISARPVIACFWHRSMLASAYLFRNLQIGIVISQSFDGECIARVVSKFHYTPIRGSSSRGGAEALAESRQLLEEGYTVAFTTDGPRGPVYVAKPGPAMLASKMGLAMVPFYVAVENAWVLNSWDRFVIPKPFARALVCLGKQIVAPANADSRQLETLHAELQAAQERVRNFAEANVKRVGSEEFPPFRRKAD